MSIFMGRSRNPLDFCDNNASSGSMSPQHGDSYKEVEVGMLIKKYYVGSLIGRGGNIIKELKMGSGGASVQFGEDPIMHNSDEWRVCAVAGNTDQVTTCVQMMGEKMAEYSQSEDTKLIFLVPTQYAESLAGKRGANMNKIEGVTLHEDMQATCTVSEKPLELPGANTVTLCSLFGLGPAVARACEELVTVLANISEKMKIGQQMEERHQMNARQHDQAMNPQMGHGRMGQGGHMGQNGYNDGRGGMQNGQGGMPMQNGQGGMPLQNQQMNGAMHQQNGQMNGMGGQMQQGGQMAPPPGMNNRGGGGGPQNSYSPQQGGGQQNSYSPQQGGGNPVFGGQQRGGQQGHHGGGQQGGGQQGGGQYGGQPQHGGPPPQQSGPPPQQGGPPPQQGGPPSQGNYQPPSAATSGWQ